MSDAIAGVVPTSLPNKDLKWETTEQWNAGLDLGFFDERIGITMDIYRKTTRDLLLDASLPFSSGYYSATKNIGKVRNDGLELSLNTVNFQTRASSGRLTSTFHSIRIKYWHCRRIRQPC